MKYIKKYNESLNLIPLDVTEDIDIFKEKFSKFYEKYKSKIDYLYHQHPTMTDEYNIYLLTKQDENEDIVISKFFIKAVSKLHAGIKGASMDIFGRENYYIDEVSEETISWYRKSYETI